MANMKQNLTCSRSKPPPARSSNYSLGRVRGQMNVDHPPSAILHTMQAQERYNTDIYIPILIFFVLQRILLIGCLS